MLSRTFFTCYLLFCSLFLSVAFAQNATRLDTLRQAVRIAPTDTARVDAMLKIVSETCLNQPDTAQNYAQAALRLMANTPPSARLALSQYWCGRTYMTHQQYTEALQSYTDAHAMAATLGDVRLQARCKGNMAIVYGTIGDYARAEQTYEEVAKIFEQQGMAPQVALSYMQIGMIENDFHKNYPKGIEILTKAADILSKLPDDTFAAELGKSYEEIGYAYSQQDNVDEAIGYFLKALQLYRKANDRIDIVQVNTKLYRAYQTKKDYERAHSYLDKAEQLAKELDNRYLVMIAHENRGSLLLTQKKYKEAVVELNTALEMGKALNVALEISETYGLLAKAHEGLRKKKEAKAYWEQKAAVDATMNRAAAPKP